MTGAGRGYRSAAYALALAQLGRPRPLGSSGGWAIERPIPGSARRDLMGPYPILACDRWDDLAEAIDALARPAGAPGRDEAAGPPGPENPAGPAGPENPAGPAGPENPAGPPGPDAAAPPVAIILVADPFAALAPAALAAIFPLCRPFRDHFVVDLAAPAPSRHHRRRLRGAGPARIEAGPPGPGLLPAWCALYDGLAARKGIADLRRFGAATFAAMLAVPGCEALTAWDGDELLGADLYYLEGEIARAHLSAYAPRGYDRAVSYPLLAAALDHLRGRGARWLDLGGAPAGAEGLRAFKAGWTSLTRTSHLCGRILDPAAYAALAPAAPTAWFPAYRAGEFGGRAGPPAPTPAQDQAPAPAPPLAYDPAPPAPPARDAKGPLAGPARPG